MKKILLLASLLIIQVNFAQNIFPTNGAVGLGTLTPDNRVLLDVNGKAFVRSLFYVNDIMGGDGGDMRIGANTAGQSSIRFMVGGVNPQEAMRVSYDGNVGIGTANPSQKLDVTGNGIFKGVIISSVSDVIGGQIQLKNFSKTANGTASSWNIYNMTSGYGNSLQFWAYDNVGCGNGGLCNNRFTIMDNGDVGIGIMIPDAKLAVNGKIHSQEVKVDLTGWSDFVFKKEYALPTLEEVEKHIAEKGHLENIPSEEEVLKNGINLGEMNSKLLQKIEELTLYMIEMKKDITVLKAENKVLKAKK